ncbi:hypothetical protein ASZ90_011228 [hydrocarbon metagenome]|uniref:Uncharacterized protein n=1 Tax=hydrocarbon metagenome TaxID=938273 RepID=A0A0W8FDS7_9ZZZZ|nr:hypothetical protein [Methanomicrobiaceae archaeon]
MGDVLQGIGDAQDFVNMRLDARFAEEGIEIPFRKIDLHMRK